MLATIAVIVLHVTSNYAAHFDKVPLNRWEVANFMDSAVRFCVPVFVMISGALLLPKEEDYFVFIKKRFTRILLPFLFWSVIYIAFLVKSSDSLSAIAKIAAKGLLKGASFHFWYVYMILGVYLFIPILSRWIAKAKEYEIQIFLGIWIITLFIDKYPREAFSKFELMYFSKYIGYLVLGYYLSTKKFTDRSKTIFVSLLLLVMGIISTFMLTHYYSAKAQITVTVFYDYLTPNVMLSSLCIFLLVKNMKLSNSVFINAVDKLSFGIYLVHILVLSKIVGQINFLETMPMAGTIAVKSLLCFSLSFTIIYLLNKIPFLKKFAT